jgi:cell wall-associated NlpC family hydrolase
MKGRCWSTVLFAAVALLFSSSSSFAKSNSASSKSSTKPKTTTQSSQTTSKPKPTTVYKVRRGDSLYEIAQRFKTTTKALMAANKLSSSKIMVGQELKVPVVKSTAAENKTPKPKTLADPKQPIMSASTSKQGDKDKVSDSDAQSMRDRLVEAGFQLIGVKYRFSGLSETSGLDCSGLVKTLFSKVNIDLPRSSREQYQQGEKVETDKLEAGDLVFFSSGGSSPTHVGIYLGNDKFLHAARKAKQVMVSDFTKFWNSMRYVGARRIMELWWEDPASTPEKE